MLDITTPPVPVCLLLLDNLLGYRSPTPVKPALCLDSTLRAWALGGSSQGLHCLVGVSLSCPAPINRPESCMMSGEAGWTVRVHTTPCIRNFSGMGFRPRPMPPERPGLQLHFWSSRSSFRPYAAQASPGWGPGPEPTAYHYTCNVANC